MAMPIKRGIKEARMSAFLFAFGTLVSYAIYGAGFLIANAFFDRGWIDGLEDVFTPVFALMFGAFGAANAQTFAADASAGNKATTNMLKMIDSGTKIDPMDTGGEQIDFEKFQGRIEFRNVHFKYPTRP